MYAHDDSTHRHAIHFGPNSFYRLQGGPFQPRDLPLHQAMKALFGHEQRLLVAVGVADRHANVAVGRGVEGVHAADRRPEEGVEDVRHARATAQLFSD